MSWSVAAVMAGECCEGGCTDADEAGGEFGGSEGGGELGLVYGLVVGDLGRERERGGIRPELNLRLIVCHVWF